MKKRNINKRKKKTLFIFLYLRKPLPIKKIFSFVLLELFLLGNFTFYIYKKMSEPKEKKK